MPTALSPGEGQDLLARLKRAREERDPDAMLELLRDDAEVRLDPFEPPLAGSLAIREHLVRWAANHANVEFDAERTWVSGRTVLTSWHGAVTRRETAERVRERGFMTLELDAEGLVERMREWTLARTVGRDASVDPGKGAREVPLSSTREVGHGR
jgi:ketosteroid isomerase-like protein